MRILFVILVSKVAEHPWCSCVYVFKIYTVAIRLFVQLMYCIFISGLEWEAEQEDLIPPYQLATPSNKAIHLRAYKCQLGY